MPLFFSKSISSQFLLASIFAVLATQTACPTPQSDLGESCDRAFCKAGLVCSSERICVDPDTQIDPDAGVDDPDAGDGGNPDTPVSCEIDGDCADNQVCDNGLCTEVCLSDEDCPGIGGIALATCVDGVCKQRCLGDATCLGGGICEANVCVDPQCATDEECADVGTAFCDGGRCTLFTPCQVDAECFDADFFCNAEVGRCEERPLCLIDNECASTELCRNNHCRPAKTCNDDAGCDADEECIVGRCVDAPECRSNQDCGGNARCSVGRCEEIDNGLPNANACVLSTPWGLCETASAAHQACHAVLFVGERMPIHAQEYDNTQNPFLGNSIIRIQQESDTLNLIDESNQAVDGNNPIQTRLNVATLTGAALLETAITQITDQLPTVSCGSPNGIPSSTLTIDVIDPSLHDGTTVLVIDATTGAPIPFATVLTETLAGQTSEVIADQKGMALLPESIDEVWAFIGARADDKRGTVVAQVPATGGVRIALQNQQETLVESGAGATNQPVHAYRANIVSTGDEVGPVGVGLALPAVSSIYQANVDTLFGGSVTNNVEIPVLGSIPIPLRQSMTLETSLPVVGNQVVRATASGITAQDRGALLVYEVRFEQNFLLNFALGATGTGALLDLATNAQGMDADIATLGRVNAVVLDAAGADGITAEPPSFSPTRLPAERVAVQIGIPPADADPRIFAVFGLATTGMGFVPTGLGTLTGSTDFDAIFEQSRVVAPDAALASAVRQAVFVAVLNDPNRQTRIFYDAAGFTGNMQVGEFLTVPDTFSLTQVGNEVVIQGSSIVDADGYRAVVDTLQGTWSLDFASTDFALAGGQTRIRLPRFVIDAQNAATSNLQSMQAADLGKNIDQSAATENIRNAWLSLYQAGGLLWNGVEIPARAISSIQAAE